MYQTERKDIGGIFLARQDPHVWGTLGTYSNPVILMGTGSHVQIILQL